MTPTSPSLMTQVISNYILIKLVDSDLEEEEEASNQQGGVGDPNPQQGC